MGDGRRRDGELGKVALLRADSASVEIVGKHLHGVSEKRSYK